MYSNDSEIKGTGLGGWGWFGWKSGREKPSGEHIEWQKCTHHQKEMSWVKYTIINIIIKFNNLYLGMF